MRDNTRVELDVRDNTRVELDVRDNTRAVKPRGSLSGTLRGIPGGGERGPRVPRGRRVDKGPVHLDSNPRMARGFGAPRGRRVDLRAK